MGSVNPKVIWERYKEQKESQRKERESLDELNAKTLKASMEASVSKPTYMEQVKIAQERATTVFEDVLKIQERLSEDYEVLVSIRAEAVADADRLASVIRMLDEELAFNEGTRKGLTNFINPLGEYEEVSITATPANKEPVVAGHDTTN